MNSCKVVRRQIAQLSSLRTEGVPEEIRQHVLQCPACAGELAVLRLERGVLVAAAEGPTPPAGFAQTVQSALPRRPAVQAEPDYWRPAWGLVPAFAATAAALLLILQTTPTGTAQAGLLPMQSLSAGEEIVLGTLHQPDMDQLLSAVLEQAEP